MKVLLCRLIASLFLPLTAYAWLSSSWSSASLQHSSVKRPVGISVLLACDPSFGRNFDEPSHDLHYGRNGRSINDQDVIRHLEYQPPQDQVIQEPSSDLPNDPMIQAAEGKESDNVSAEATNFDLFSFTMTDRNNIPDDCVSAPAVEDQTTGFQPTELNNQSTEDVPETGKRKILRGWELASRLNQRNRKMGAADDIAKQAERKAIQNAENSLLSRTERQQRAKENFHRDEMSRWEQAARKHATWEHAKTTRWLETCFSRSPGSVHVPEYAEDCFQ